MKYIEYNNRIKIKDDTGFYLLNEDQKAIEEYMQFINYHYYKFNTIEDKINYLIDNKYYINFLKFYSLEEIQKFYDYAKKKQFKFESFMACQKFYETYSLKSKDKKLILEHFYETVVRVAMALNRNNFDKCLELIDVMMNREFQPATPTFLNAGKLNSGELVSCFLLDIDDSLNAINYNLSTAMQLSKIGGGVALNLSNLRASGDSIRGIENISRGVLPVMKLLEDAFSYVDQLGQRPGAGAVYLNIFHADCLDFLDTKKINADEKSRIQTLSLGLVIPDKFMELCQNNEDLCMFYPHTIYQKYGKTLDEININESYETLIKDPDIKFKKIKAREMLKQIAMTQFESGYPYLIFIDNANRAHNLDNIGKIKISNLCTEIFQVQTTSQINDYGEDDIIGYDISCNLGSLNIFNLMKSNSIEKTITTSIEALTKVSELSNIKNAPGVYKANKDLHAVGLGVMNLHGYLTSQKIAYESDDAIDFCNVLFPIINYYSLKASMNIAINRKEVFKGFEGSKYATGEYFELYLNNEYQPKNEKIIKIFESIKIPTINDWKELKEQVQKNGLYNAYRLAIAPTQSISYIQNATASIQPIVSQIETRMYKNSQTYYPMPFLKRDTSIYYKSAYNMNQKKIIDLVATIQPHIDQGISTVLFVTNNTTTNQLAHLYYYAYRKGLKSLYYVRTKNLTVEECETCSV